LFMPEQNELLIELMQLVTNFKYKDPSNPPTLHEVLGNRISKTNNLRERIKPEFVDVVSPMSLYVHYWQSYLVYAGMHGRASNKKGTKHHDTSKKRLSDLKKLAKSLGHQPTGKDLKEFFQLPPKFDEICEVIDRDIKKIVP
jgi:hypothetical protein